MRTIEMKLYSFDELSDEAKDRAIKDRRNENNDYFHVWDDAHNTVKEFNNLFELDEGSRSWLDYGHHFPDQVIDLTGLRLRKYILNNYGHVLYEGKYYGKLVYTHKDGTKIERSEDHPAGSRHVKRYSKVLKEGRGGCNLTGVCYDEHILEPIYNFIDVDYKDETINIVELLNDCFSSLRESIDREIEYLESDEGITEEILSLDNEYTEYGEEYF